MGVIVVNNFPALGKLAALRFLEWVQANPGGIGPDGHIAFNVKGSNHQSTTRLTPTNYETQASAAADLGGIEVARERHAITIGLATITYNRNCTAIIIAAGEAKAKVVRNAVHQKPHIRYRATMLLSC